MHTCAADGGALPATCARVDVGCTGTGSAASGFVFTATLDAAACAQDSTRAQAADHGAECASITEVQHALAVGFADGVPTGVCP
eukprot:COSAG01_NODE_1120_length_11632_cov_50.655770_2_plen_84_part_00